MQILCKHSAILNTRLEHPCTWYPHWGPGTKHPVDAVDGWVTALMQSLHDPATEQILKPLRHFSELFCLTKDL